MGRQVFCRTKYLFCYCVFLCESCFYEGHYRVYHADSRKHCRAYEYEHGVCSEIVVKSEHYKQERNEHGDEEEKVLFGCLCSCVTQKNKCDEEEGPYILACERGRCEYKERSLYKRLPSFFVEEGGCHKRQQVDKTPCVSTQRNDLCGDVDVFSKHRYSA